MQHKTQGTIAIKKENYFTFRIQIFPLKFYKLLYPHHTQGNLNVLNMTGVFCFSPIKYFLSTFNKHFYGP